MNFDTLPLVQRTETATATSTTPSTTTTASTGTTAVIHPPPNQNADGALQTDVAGQALDAIDQASDPGKDGPQ